MPLKRRIDFFLHLGRIFVLLILLAVLLPKLAAVCNIWLSTHLHDEQRPYGNPLRVELPKWSEFVMELFPAAPPDR